MESVTLRFYCSECALYWCRSEQLEKSNVLRTKVLRERDEVKMAVRHYKFVVIRVRMPDGIILQGVWHDAWGPHPNISHS